MNKNLRRLGAWFICMGFGMSISTLNAQQIKPSSSKALQEAVKKHQELNLETPFSQFPVKNVGPTNTSGRIVDIEVSQDFKTYYIAAASGGVWKTEDNGQSFLPIFDHQGALGIGDMALSPSDNNILWVGTGENNSSRSTYAGSGLYKSTDAGKTWEFMGLPFSQHIGQIQIHPSNPDVVWVGSMGSLYSKNDERGFYKTTDGGKSWKKTLYINDNTGIIDIKIDPSNPDIILAASWERMRQSHDFIGNGKGSAIWRSVDGGDTWKKAMDGFPQDEFVGRIGFDFSLSNPKIVYALHDYQKAKESQDGPRAPAEKSDDLSLESFLTISNSGIENLEDEKLDKFLRSNRFATKYDASEIKRLVRQSKITPSQIANYNGELKDANSILLSSSVMGAEVYRSEDSGISWKKVNQPGLDRVYNSYGYYFGEVRVSTEDENELFILGVPLLVSRDGGQTFANTDSIGNVHSDHQSMWINPKDAKHILLGTDGGLYSTFGGGARWDHLNTQLTISQFYSVMVDEATPYNIYGGMQDNGVWYGKSTDKPEVPWKSLMGGDGMVVAVDTRTNDVVYTGFQFGNYFRINTSTNERKSVTPSHDIGNKPNRWNWRTPATLSKHNQDILYMGSQYVYRSLDRGDTWETISQDLTKNQKSGNVPFATLTVLEESPLQYGVMYTGTDDGNLWITKDHGINWTDITKGLPQDRWVSSVTPSKHEEGLVYVTLTGYRFDEFTAYVYKSKDYGKTWSSISANLPAEGANILKEDIKDPNILYLGTDHGLYVSLDAGLSFASVQGTLPNVSIYDMVIQEKENHLVIGTHGRSVYVMDLAHFHKIRKTPKEILALEIPEIRLNPRWSNPAYSGTKPSQQILYYVKNAETVEFVVKNDKQETVKSWSQSAIKGINNTVWNLKLDKGLIPKGKYTLQISNSSSNEEGSFDVK